MYVPCAHQARMHPGQKGAQAPLSAESYYRFTGQRVVENIWGAMSTFLSDMVFFADNGMSMLDLTASEDDCALPRRYQITPSLAKSIVLYL